MLGRRKNAKEKGWKVSIDRPEEIYVEPSKYYTDEEVKKYILSGGMKRTQEKIAYRILELAKLKGGKVLDMGCGIGYTASVYEREGFSVVGLDVLPKMLEEARKKGLRVVEGDMRDVSDMFGEGSFDAIFSVSALQWLKEKKDLEKVAFGIRKVLKAGGKLVIQFYPKTEEEMMMTAKIFKKAGFEGQIIIDNPKNPMKRVIFLVMDKV
ncbi:class I SAM-dependent methyltransferase [Nanoarchaeota archaeon]